MTNTTLPQHVSNEEHTNQFIQSDAGHIIESVNRYQNELHTDQTGMARAMNALMSATLSYQDMMTRPIDIDGLNAAVNSPPNYRMREVKVNTMPMPISATDCAVMREYYARLRTALMWPYPNKTISEARMQLADLTREQGVPRIFGLSWGLDKLAFLILKEYQDAALEASIVIPPAYMPTHTGIWDPDMDLEKVRGDSPEAKRLRTAIMHLRQTVTIPNETEDGRPLDAPLAYSRHREHCVPVSLDHIPPITNQKRTPLPYPSAGIHPRFYPVLRAQYPGLETAVYQHAGTNAEGRLREDNIDEDLRNLAVIHLPLSQHDERLLAMVYRACLRRGLHEHIMYILTRDLMFRAWRSRVYEKAKPVPSIWGSTDLHKHLLNPEMIDALMHSINCGCFDMGLKRAIQCLLFPDFSFADRAAFTQGPVMYAGHAVHLYDRLGAWAHGMRKMTLIDAVYHEALQVETDADSSDDEVMRDPPFTERPGVPLDYLAANLKPQPPPDFQAVIEPKPPPEIKETEAFSFHQYIVGLTQLKKSVGITEEVFPIPTSFPHHTPSYLQPDIDICLHGYFPL